MKTLTTTGAAAHPNSCQSPLGVQLYHLGNFAGLRNFNQYVSVGGRQLSRKATPSERTIAVRISRAMRVHLMGKRAPFDYDEAERMFDMLHLAWSSKVIGSTFTLRAMKFLLGSIVPDRAGKTFAYCSDIYALTRRGALAKVRSK